MRTNLFKINFIFLHHVYKVCRDIDFVINPQPVTHSECLNAKGLDIRCDSHMLNL